MNGLEIRLYIKGFSDVTRGCPIPILGLGAEKTPKQIQALELAEKIVHGGERSSDSRTWRLISDQLGGAHG
jgi:hypothetical protein